MAAEMWTPTSVEEYVETCDPDGRLRLLGEAELLKIAREGGLIPVDEPPPRG